MKTSFILLIILTLGFLAHSRVVVFASVFVLLLKKIEVNSIVVFFSERGIEIGLIFLLLSILSSLILNPLDGELLKNTFISRKGIVAIIAGIVATRFNGLGLKLLQRNPQIIIGIIFGSLIGIGFLGGIPVGPLTAAGLTAVILELLSFFL